MAAILAADIAGYGRGSKFDLQPVLDTIARVASQLCVAEDVVIHLREQSDLTRNLEISTVLASSRVRAWTSSNSRAFSMGDDSLVGESLQQCDLFFSEWLRRQTAEQ